MKNKLKVLLRGVLALAAGVPLLSPVCSAQQASQAADLNISPKRLVFSSDNRSATVYVFNRGSAGATYSIDLVDRIMLQDGQIMALGEVKKGADTDAIVARLKSARELITFSPRRVTLGPGESQIIRVRVLTPPNLPAGEYRSHFTVTTLPPENLGVTAEQIAQPAEGQLSMTVVSLLSLSIPLIVRQDTPAGKAELAALKLTPNPGRGSTQPPATLDLALTRSGSGSIYGSLEVLAQKGSGKGEPLGGIKGIAVYPELEQRPVSIGLSRLPTSGERLTVRFVEDDDSGRVTVLSSANLDVK